MQADPAVDWREVAEGNERLRRLLVQELESTRDQLSAAAADSKNSRSEMMAHHVQMTAEIEARQTALEDSMAQLEQSRAEAAQLHLELEQLGSELATAKDTISRQQAHIMRLKTQLSRPVRLLAKKVLKRAPQPPSANPANHAG